MSGPNDALPEDMTGREAGIVRFFELRMERERERRREELTEALHEAMAPVMAKLSEMGNDSAKFRDALSKEIADLHRDMQHSTWKQDDLVKRVEQIEDDKKAIVRWTLGSIGAAALGLAASAWAWFRSGTP